MPSLENVLASIPGAAGFYAKRQMNEQGDATQIQQASTLLDLQRAMQQQRLSEQEAGRNEALRAEIEALPPEKRTKENVVPLLLKHGNVKELVPLLKGKDEGGFTLKEGEKRFDSEGNPIADAGSKATKPIVEHNYPVSATMVQPHVSLDNGITWNPIPGSTPSQKFATPGSTINPAPVTTAEVIDPSDPTRMLKIDARTYKGGTLGAAGVLGVSGNVSAREKLDMKRAFNMQGIGKVIQEADDILTGKNGDPLPTQSGIGTGVDAVAGFFGATPAGAPQADKLRAIGGALTTKMPRMEGPQSDRDVVLYREMAARVGDSTLPVERRRAALETVKELWAKYERLNPDAFAGPAQGAPVTAPGAPVPASPATPTAAPSGSGQWSIKPKVPGG